MKNLFIVGAQRSGSSFLRNLLDLHESVTMARPFDPEPRYFLGKDDLDKLEYESLYFKNVTKETVYLGEKSTSYFESKLAAKQIYNFYPNSKIIIILRNPSERAWSNYKFSKLNKIENLEFIDSIKLDAEKRKYEGFSVNPFAYISRSKYEVFLEIYKEIFPSENVKVLIFEEFITDPSGGGLYEWLGISSQVNTVITRVNTSYKEDLGIKQKKILHKEFEHTIQFVEDFLGRTISSWRDI